MPKLFWLRHPTKKQQNVSFLVQILNIVGTMVQIIYKTPLKYEIILLSYKVHFYKKIHWNLVEANFFKNYHTETGQKQDRNWNRIITILFSYDIFTLGMIFSLKKGIINSSCQFQKCGVVKTWKIHPDDLLYLCQIGKYLFEQLWRKVYIKWWP